MKIILIIIGIILILVPAIHLIIYRFSHIDMTTTRIFVNNWYWYIPLIFGFLLIQFKIYKK